MFYQHAQTPGWLTLVVAGLLVIGLTSCSDSSTVVGPDQDTEIASKGKPAKPGGGGANNTFDVVFTGATNAVEGAFVMEGKWDSAADIVELDSGTNGPGAIYHLSGPADVSACDPGTRNPDKAVLFFEPNPLNDGGVSDFEALAAAGVARVYLYDTLVGWDHPRDNDWELAFSGGTRTYIGDGAYQYEPALVKYQSKRGKVKDHYAFFCPSTDVIDFTITKQ